MTDKDEIEVEIMSEDDFDIETEEKPKDSKSNKGVGLISVLCLTFFAAVLGALGGAFGTQYVVPQKDLSSELSDVKTQFNQSIDLTEQKVEKDIQAMANKIEALERQLRVMTNDETLSASVQTLSSRLDSLETTLPSEIAAINPETLTALNQAEADGFAWPNIDPVEESLEEIKSDILTLNEKFEKLSVQNLEAPSIASLESGDQTLDVSVERTVEPSSQFPAAKLTALAEAQQAPKGFLSRTLSKHITVRDPSDPVILIEKTAEAVKSGNYAEAIKAYDKLPENIRVAGQDWRNSVLID